MSIMKFYFARQIVSIVYWVGLNKKLIVIVVYTSEVLEDKRGISAKILLSDKIIWKRYIISVFTKCVIEIGLRLRLWSAWD